MNILHLKYAVEVERTRSISKAAQNLYMGQPNLSRTIKELEESLGITIFKRTSHGISLTPQGEEFMQYARNIISQVEQVEALYQGGKKRQNFSVMAPRAGYIAEAFVQFAEKLGSESPSEVFYQETNAQQAVNGVLQSDCRLGIIRYQKEFESQFMQFLKEKGLASQTLAEFCSQVLLSRKNPLAEHESISAEDLAGCIELAAADQYVPLMTQLDARRAEVSSSAQLHIYVHERCNQVELLNRLSNAFLWAPPLPWRRLKELGLVQRPSPQGKCYRDVLICRKGYHLTDLDQQFIDLVCQNSPGHVQLINQK